MAAEKEGKAGTPDERRCAERVAGALLAPLLILDEHLTVLYANPSYRRCYPSVPKETVGMNLYDLHATMRKDGKLGGLLARLVDANEPFSGFTVEQDVAGRGRSALLFSGSKIESERGAPKLFLLAVEDITEHAAAAKHRHALEEMIERSPDIICRLDTQGRYIYANPAIEKGTGIPRERFIGRQIGELTAGIQPENRAMFRQAFEKTVASKTGTDVELSLGSRIFQICFEPEIGESGEPVSLMVYGHDITEIRRAEEVLRPSQATLNAFFEASAGNLSIVDDKFCFVNTDNITVGYFGLDREGMAGKCLRDLAPEFEKTYGTIMREVLATGKPRFNVQVQAPVPSRHGEMACWRVSYFRVPLAGGKWGLGIIGMEITDMVRAEQSLQRYRHLVENAPVAIAISREGRTVYGNQHYLKIFGFQSLDELQGRAITEQIVPRCRDDITEWLCRREEDKAVPGEFETIGLRKDGSEFPFYVAVTTVDLDDGPAILGSFIDITERKRAENALKQAKDYADTLLRTANALVVELDREGNVTAMNQAAETVTGYRFAELERRNWFEILVPPARFPGIREDFMSHAEAGAPWRQESAVITKNGGDCFIVWQNSIVREQGRPCGTISFGIDVTEMKRIEKELKASEERTRYILKHTPNALAVVDNDMRYIMVSDRFLSDYHLGDRDIIGLRHYDVFPEMPERWKEIHRRSLRGSVERCDDDHFVREDGSIDYNRWEVRPWYDAKGSIGGIIMFTEVTTERRRAEEALRQREEEFRVLVENSPDIIARYDRQLRHIYINPKITQVTGLPKEKFLGRTNADLGMPGDLVRLWDEYQKAVFETGREHSVEYAFPGPAGTIYYHARVVPVCGKDGDVESIISIMHDISEMKNAQRELARARELAEKRADEAEEGRRTLDALMNNIPEGIMIADASGSIKVMSRYMSQIAGIAPENARGKSIKSVESCLGREENAVLDAPREYPLARALLNGETTYSEERLLSTAKGSPMNVVITAVPIRDIGGKITGGMTAWRDITDRRKMEDQLRRNEYELRTLVDNSPDLVVRFDRFLRYVYANPAYERITGMPREQLLGKTNEELGMPQEQLRYWTSTAQQVFATGREESVEFNFPGFFGKRYFWGRVIPEYAKDGTVEMVMTVSRDITERKLAEEKIRYISFHDETTGLYNRAYFEEELRRLDTERELPVSIIMGDVNNLKLTNDTFGHGEGDRLLKRIAAILRVSCREKDVIARWGGDEFTIILPKTEFGVAEEALRRIMQECDGVSDMLLRPSISLGVATKSRREMNIYQVLREAEAMMYEHKSMSSKANHEAVVESLLKEIDRKEHRDGGHRRRLRELAARMAGVLGLNGSQANELDALAQLHDIGKIIIPEEILSGDRRLVPAAWSAMMKCPETGYRIVHSISDCAYVADSVLACRERWDGGGYPRGLKGEEIPLSARILSIFDGYDVMTHGRPYARTLTHEQALAELRRGAGKQFDPKLVEKLIGALVLEKVP